VTERVVLVNPNQIKPAVAPIALDYLADALTQHHFQVDVLDLCFSPDWAEDIDTYFARNSVSAVGVSLRNSDDTSFASQEFFLPGFKQMIDRIRMRTLAPVIIGGSAFSVMPEDILDYCGVDLGIIGDGEAPLPLLMEKLIWGGDYKYIPGLVYRYGGGFQYNPPSYINPNPNNAPTPKRTAVDNYRYFVEGGMGNIESKRGCHKGCIYCADPPAKGRVLRLRSPESVVDEMESLLQMGIDYFHFCDSEFNLPPSHAEQVCLEIIRRGLGDRLHWYVYCSPAPFTQEMAALFQRAGCQGINFGVDSGVDRMLHTLGRDFRVDDVRRTAAICHEQSLVFMYDLLLGGPGETRETLRQTVEVMKELSPSRVGAALGVRIFPGTALSDTVRRMGPMHANPNLKGNVIGNERFFAPVFYLSAALGEDAAQYLADLVGGNEQFFLMSPPEGSDRNYNYNQNTLLVEAIRQGYKGAFWDILRRISEDGFCG
jgi:radical SAM superfamily enzyme YgiQ (UPF0313 family)